MNRLALTVLALASVLGGSVAEAQTQVIRPVAPVAPLQINRALTRPIVPSFGLRVPGTTASTQAPAPAPAPAPARPGMLRCEVTENGVAAPAAIVVRQGNTVIASGSCVSPITLAPGAYVATLTLETALDRPTQRVPVQITDGGEVVARAAFSTAILEVRFTERGAPSTGLAIVQRDGVTIGTLGSGVTARLSAGTYEVVARHRTGERTFSVPLVAEQRRALRADF